MKKIILALLIFISGQVSVIAQESPQAMIVFDASGSMWGQIDGTPKINIAKDALSNVITEWDETIHLGLMTYGHRRKGDCDDIQVLFPIGVVDKRATLSTVKKINPKGKTPISRSIRMAAEQLRYTEEKATVVLISDGKEDQDCDPSMVKTYSWDYAVGNFQDVSFAGYHNWRLPTIKELSTLIHCSNKLPQHLSRLEGCDAQWKIQGKSTKPTLNHRVFPNAPAQRYWSSSPFYDNKDYAKAVCFYSGHVEELYKHHNLSVRLVRNTTSQENYLR